MFDINDFDETSQGPWEWDLKRLTTSFVLAARENGQAAACGGGGAHRGGRPTSRPSTRWPVWAGSDAAIA